MRRRQTSEATSTRDSQCDSIYVKDGDEYVLYKKDRKKLDYSGLIKEANRK